MTKGDTDTILRPATVVDLTRIVLIEKECFEDPWTPDLLQLELLPDPLRFALVAEQKGEVVAYLMAWRVVDQLHILNIAVSERARRGRIGSRLLRAAAAEARRCGLLEITLEVRRGNQAALDFYHHHGFVQVGLRRGYYPDSGEDALVLNRRSDTLLVD